MSFGFGLALPRAYNRGAAWSPASLFTGGVQGVWYDPSDVLLNWRTNLLTYSQEFNNAAWTLLASASRSANYTTAPDGTLTADRLQFTASSGDGIQQLYVTSSGANVTYTGSVYIKSNTAGNFNIRLKNTHAAVVDNFKDITVTPIWQRFDITVTNGASAGTGQYLGIVNASTSPQAVDIAVWGAQLELGSTATAYQAITTPEQTYLTYDPQPVLFQDAAGTTPVTAVEQPVRLMLDKSQGLVLGSELVTNGNFATDTAWTKAAGVTISGGAANFSAVTSSSALYQNITAISVGNFYAVTYTLNVSAGSVQTQINGNPALPSRSTSGTFTEIINVSAATNKNFIFLTNGFTGTIDNVSVKLLPGNHATASNDASRPVLRARYNLLTYSEQFDNAAWAILALNAFGSGSVANTTGTTDPLGGNTADYIQESTATSVHSVYRAVTSDATTYTFSVYAKKAQRSWLSIRAACSAGNGRANFDLENGVVGNVAADCTASIQAIGNGWYRCSTTGTWSTSGSKTYYIGVIDSNRSTGSDPSYAGDGTSGIYVWGADLRFGSSAGTYQRIAAATDYATAGFLPYLAFDGSDDSLLTGNIDFSGTDKMTVWAGVTSFSLTTATIIVELTGISTTAGAFTLFAGGAIAERLWGWSTSSAQNFIGTSSYPPPSTVVMTAVMDRAASTPVTILGPRLNGMPAVVADQASGALSGNFASAPLFIGRRNNASLPLNGRLYSLIVAGKTVSASELASTEAYVAAKTGVTLLVPTFDYYTTQAGDFIILDNGDNVVSPTYYV